MFIMDCSIVIMSIITMSIIQLLNGNVSTNMKLQQVGQYAHFGNVVMYQNYIYDVIAKHVLTCQMFLKKIFYYINNARISALAFFISCLVEQFQMHS